MSIGFSGSGVCRVCGQGYCDASTCPHCGKHYLEDIKIHRNRLARLGITILPRENWEELKIITQQLERHEISEASSAPLIRAQLDQARKYSRNMEAKNRADQAQKQKDDQMVNYMSEILKKW